MGELCDPGMDGRIPLSPELQHFYTWYEIRSGTDITSLGMRSAAVEIGDAAVLFFPKPEHLFRQQLGYRWLGTGEPYQASPSWPPEHVVIANYNDDPLIVDTASPASPVYGQIDGSGAFPIADSLADFFSALALLIEAAFAMEGNVTNEETFEIEAAFVEEVRPKLLQLLGEEKAENVMKYLSFY
ncbi:hypothetical protein [Paenibacillus sp. AR247]|uniref:hypothetical protein n=1 Tax=Paenibacillus sp. AR247 TaxID=1631599 RepID=UPI0011B02AB3|nr:hypothetical protein [Paenibacillus sp. AR247]